MKVGTQIKLRQLAVITTAWVLFGFLMTLYDHMVLHTDYSEGTAPDYTFTFALALNLLSALIGSLIGGSFLVFYVNEKYADKPYGYTLIAVCLSFLGIIMLIAILLAVIVVPMKTGKPLWDPLSSEALRNFLFNARLAKNTIAWFVIVGMTQLLLQINSKFGEGAFWNIVRGKYNTPKEEKRIFMFLDLNSSTAIAEQLGNAKYHQLLKDFFAGITGPVLEHHGEIYQYVGDEVVVSWKLQDEATKNNHCLFCFFAMKDSIDQKREKYIRRYGLVPSFKAGIHCGKVVAGEVGIIKRDISYSGDVLNTTARILSKCSDFNSEVIVSSGLLNAVDLPGLYLQKALGGIPLKGKSETIPLFSILRQ
jgi:adenylate cyclase